MKKQLNLIKLEIISQDVFMGVSLDTYDAETGIHPRNKQTPSKRLATAGLNVAYGRSEYPTNGPYPASIDMTVLDNGIQIDITYDQPFEWNPTESEGFYICSLLDTRMCNSQGGRWELVSYQVTVLRNYFLCCVV